MARRDGQQVFKHEILIPQGARVMTLFVPQSDGTMKMQITVVQEVGEVGLDEPPLNPALFHYIGEALTLSQRAQNVLTNHGVRYVGELAQMTIDQNIQLMQGAGGKTRKELKRELEYHGLRLGMRFDSQQLEEELAKRGLRLGRPQELSYARHIRNPIPAWGDIRPWVDAK